MSLCPGRREACPGPLCPTCLLVAGRGDLLCWCLFFPVVSSDSDGDSDLSSSSLEDRLPPTGVRDLKGDKPWGQSGECGKHRAGL